MISSWLDHEMPWRGTLWNLFRFAGHHEERRRAFALFLLTGVLFAVPSSAIGGALENGFDSPPPEARIRAYWWWLNGNVTKASITRDLAGMASKGYGGALICDAGGAEQWGNSQVPHGPTFFTAEWRELYKHALREANRLGLELSLNIQSGWNLGGPTIKPEDAPKKLVWSEVRVRGAGWIERRLIEPDHPPEFYQDLFVLAYPVRATNAILKPSIRSSSSQNEHPSQAVIDGVPNTFWVSRNTTPGNGPSRDRPEWLRFDLREPVMMNALTIEPRSGYGPKEGSVKVADDAGHWQTVKRFTMEDGQPLEIRFNAVRVNSLRIEFSSAYDASYSDAPRNVQVAEVRWSGPEHSWPAIQTPIQNLSEKALRKALHFSAPETGLLLEELSAVPGEQTTTSGQVIDLTSKMDSDGVLKWNAPSGEWEILRLGCTLNDHCRVSTCSEGWQGYALDPFNADVFHSYWNEVVEPLIADAGPLAGNTLKYLHTDSWEVEVANWTPGLREEFRKRRGYDPLPYLPVITGAIVDSRPISNRFLNDFRRTMGDLAIDNHYRLFKEGAHRHGMLIHPESGGPHAIPVDSLQCLGHNDVPMSEFWAWSWEHRIGDRNRFFVKQPATAAHTYGRKLVAAEGFTTIGPHWQERIWENLKPSFDKAVCEGLNRLVWHTFTCSPEEMGLPGQEYFAGTHFNPNSTWWPKSAPFIRYLNRVQFLMQQGLFVADAIYYYGSHVPNFAQLKESNPAQVLPGYDYDVATEEVVLTRMSVKGGRIVLPDGMSYRILVLPDYKQISLPVLRKVMELVEAGATVVGPRPDTAISLEDYPRCDTELRQLSDQLWGETEHGARVQRNVGKGRIISGRTGREVLLADGVAPDFEYHTGTGNPLDYIHRRDGGTEIYFIANRTNTSVTASCIFRVRGLAPELWDAVTGERRFAVAYEEKEDRTVVPLDFTPCGSWVVVFREPSSAHPSTAGTNTRDFKEHQTLDGSWTVNFDPGLGGPGAVGFDSQTSWTERSEPGIKYYSGVATYTKSFEISEDWIESAGTNLFLDLGEVRELAEVKVNGKSCGITWSPPFRVPIGNAITSGENKLEIEVVNFWPNRIIGDAALPEEQRITRTNIRRLTKDTPLMESGLFGPVTVLERQ